jgi:hypothetical protein
LLTLRFSPPRICSYRIALDSDAADMGGYGLVDHKTIFRATDYAYNGRPASMQVYLPARTALVFSLVP